MEWMRKKLVPRAWTVYHLGDGGNGTPSGAERIIRFSLVDVFLSNGQDLIKGDSYPESCAQRNAEVGGFLRFT
jgi:hypothetical protein